MITASGEGWRLEIGMPDEYRHAADTGPVPFDGIEDEPAFDMLAADSSEYGSQPEEELVFGEYETKKVRVGDLVRLPQVRSGLNPDLPDLKESIKVNGLLNPIDIAVMDEAALRDYIGFTNRLWGKDVRFEDYIDLKQPDGTYNLVIAGHTRAEAISQLQAEEQSGRQFSIQCKIHPATDPHSIISLQLDENIHSKPSLERRAMAIVEAWLYGLENGLWKNKAEFLRSAGKKFNTKNLNDAIAFSQLPSEVRDFVFEGNVSYGASVELGRSVATVRDYVRLRMGATETESGQDGPFEEAYRMKIGTIIQHIFSRGLKVGAATGYIKSQVEMMEVSLGRAKAQPEMALFSQAEQYGMGYEKIKSDYLEAVRETNSLAKEKRERQLRLQRELTNATELLIILERVRTEEPDLAA